MIMTTRSIVEIDIASFFMAALVGIIVGMYFNHKPNNKLYLSLPVAKIQQNPNSTLSPIPTVTPTPKIETFTQISPNGAKTLTMSIKANKNASKTYTFTTSDSTNTNPQLIYSTTLSSKEGMSIPFNTWSSDNTYVFLEYNKASGNEALVFKADGGELVAGQNYFNVTELFTAKNTGNTYHETTGWASDTLLIVNTTNKDGSKGPSYWFEVPSKAIIQLSTQF